MSALTLPEEVTYDGMEMVTGETQKKSLRIHCRTAAEDTDAEKIERDQLFFDAAMLFATIENLEECVFVINGKETAPAAEMAYDREEVTDRIGVETLWKDLEGEELRAWLEELHLQALLYLHEEP